MKEKTMFENYGYSYPPLERSEEEGEDDSEDSPENEPNASEIDQSDLDE